MLFSKIFAACFAEQLARFGVAYLNPGSDVRPCRAVFEIFRHLFDFAHNTPPIDSRKNTLRQIANPRTKSENLGISVSLPFQVKPTAPHAVGWNRKS